jgi:protein-L-isoaspartate(D-aspartate) O-methyltransferase
MGNSEVSLPFWWATPATVLGFLVVGVIGGAMIFSHRDSQHTPIGSGTSAGQEGNDSFASARRSMVEEQLRARDITDQKVLDVMGRVARERFVPEAEKPRAYDDHPLPIGPRQTISQPYIVALMTQLARPAPNDRALEVGVGSGYQTAILAELCNHVYGIEIIESLAKAARERLDSLGYTNVTIRCGDGYQGWREHGPFDVILVTAAPDHVPQPLIDQLAPGGRIVIPVGGMFQDLLLIEKRPDGSIRRHGMAPVQFVPMTGEAEEAGSR